VVAFIASLLILVIFVLPIFPYAKRRPQGAPLTWGEAMAAATYSFFLMFWAYGVVPHLWLTWADNELKWRPDFLAYNALHLEFLKPQEFGGPFPMTITMQTIRDLIATLIYVAFLGGQIALWAVWQGRGAKKAEVVTSEYGRPLVRKA
jgi:hypothetical protein